TQASSCKEVTVKQLSKLNTATTVFGLSVDVIVILSITVFSLTALSAHAQTPSAEVEEAARSPEQDSRDTNEIDNSEPAEKQPSPNQTVQLGLLPFVPPPEEPAPQNTLGGGRRNGQCRDSAELSRSTTAHPQLATLTPPPQIVGLTEREKPTVWLYQPISSVRQIILSVREEDSQQFHSQTTIDVPRNNQWVPLQLPEDAPPLESETNYVWAAIVLCGNAPSPNDPALSTRVRRVNSPASLSASTTATAPLAVAEQYARQGQWYDAVDAFVQAQLSNAHSNGEHLTDNDVADDDLSETWQALLDYAELSAIATPFPSPTVE
ncbi:MAG: DUF928 domain-containing protein, partial [Cyanobacteria bacterium J06555_12]